MEMTSLESDIKLEMEKVKLKNEKLARLNDHKYDPNCKFCINNVFVKDALKTEAEIESDRERLIPMMDAYKTKKQTLAEIAWVVGDSEKFQKLKTDKLLLENKIEKTKGDISRHETQLAQYSEKLSGLSEKITEFYAQRDIILNNRQINLEIDKVKPLISQKNFEYKNLNGQLASCSARLQVYLTEKLAVESTIEKIKRLETQVEVYAKYLTAIDRNGIPYELITQAMPFLSQEVNNLLIQIVNFTIAFESDGKNIYAYIVSATGKNRKIEMGSGMEKFISSIAIRVALTKLSNLPRPEILVVDEGWGTLDAQHISKIKKVFDQLKVYFNFILIISHIDSIKDSVDYILEIDRIDGFSKINHL
jgi:exonuclease SbcC